MKKNRDGAFSLFCAASGGRCGRRLSQHLEDDVNSCGIHKTIGAENTALEDNYVVRKTYFRRQLVCEVDLISHGNKR